MIVLSNEYSSNMHLNANFLYVNCSDVMDVSAPKLAV